MLLSELLVELETIAPLALAEEWDNVGLLISPTQPREVTRALFTIDATAGTLAEARRLDAQLIVAYHPPIFSGLKRLVPSERSSRWVLEAIEQRVAVYSPHTALDAAPGGVNDWLAGAFEWTSLRALQPKGDVLGRPHDHSIGQGRLLELARPERPHEVLERIKRYLGLDTLRFAAARNGSGAEPERPIASIALCPGAGGSVLAGVKADLYLTGEMRHHDVLAAVDTGTCVVLTEHTNSERGYLPELAARLKERAPALDVRIAISDADPLRTV